MGNGIVRIRVSGVAITIVDGNISIEQTSPVAATKAPSARAAAQAIPAPAPTDGAIPQPAAGEAEHIMPVGINPDPRLLNGAAEIHEAPSDLKKFGWSDDEIQTLRELYPTHSASVIAKQLGRRVNAVKSKAQNLGLRKDAPPKVTSPRGPAPKPRSLSAAVTAESAPAANGFGAVALLDHRPGQCRWIVSDTWPVLYCGEPVVDCLSWCEQHFGRVFNHGRGTGQQRLTVLVNSSRPKSRSGISLMRSQ
jgi:hypothetical protein